MEDIKYAKEQLLAQQLTLCMVKEGQVCYTSRERGILPLYRAVTQPGDGYRGASAADRIVGRGAALLFIHLGIRELHAEVISDAAYDVLAAAGIPATWDRRVERIQNRDKTGLCPVESLAMDADSAETLLPRVEAFLKKVGALQ